LYCLLVRLYLDLQDVAMESEHGLGCENGVNGMSAYLVERQSNAILNLTILYADLDVHRGQINAMILYADLDVQRALNLGDSTLVRRWKLLHPPTSIVTRALHKN